MGEWAGYEAIIFSAIAAEAFLSDFAEMSQFLSDDDESEKLKAARDVILKAEEKRFNIRKKYQQTYRALTGKNLPTSSEWWADYDLLVRLRNELVHAKVDHVINNYPERILEIQKKLDEKGLLMWGIESSSDWRNILDRWDKLGDWAVTTVKNLVLIFIAEVPESRFRQNYANGFSSPHSAMNRPLKFS
jgi:hypothetical protein